MKQHHHHYLDFFRNINPNSISDIYGIFTADARFKDTFNDVKGCDKIFRVFEHMYETSDKVEFIIKHAGCDELAGGDILLIVWLCVVHPKGGKKIEFMGSSKVNFNTSGQAIEHIDYWDPAESIYETVPLLGGLMRFLKNKLSAS